MIKYVGIKISVILWDSQDFNFIKFKMFEKLNLVSRLGLDTFIDRNTQWCMLTLMHYTVLFP